MMDKNDISRYFSENAADWLSDAYDQGDYNYPVGLHRTRLVTEILDGLFDSQGLNLIDIGCGGGDLCISAAQLGYHATGIDQSAEMIGVADARRRSLPADTASRVSFKRCSLDEIDQHLSSNAYAVATAMGFIGYLPDDGLLFAAAHKLLKPGGRLIVSCRNRLFNMTSISKYTVHEIKNSTALALIEELEELYHHIPEKNTVQFLQLLKETASQFQLEQLEPRQKVDTVSSSETEAVSTPTIEARQHTPKQLGATAKSYGFTNTGLYGVHPHIIAPRLNTLLPPQVFNRLSDCLCAFEKLPISLAWSSVFLAVFQKT